MNGESLFSIFFTERLRKKPVYGKDPFRTILEEEEERSPFSAFFKTEAALPSTTELAERPRGELKAWEPSLVERAKIKAGQMAKAGISDITEMLKGIPQLPVAGVRLGALPEPERTEQVTRILGELGKEEAKAYGEIVKHPVRSVEQHPVHTVARLLPIIGIPGIFARITAGGKLGQVGTKLPLLQKTLLRPFSYEPELQTLFRQQRGRVGLGRLKATETAESLYADLSGAERLRLGQIIRGGIDPRGKAKGITEPIKRLREELATELKERGLLAEESFLTKLPKRRVKELMDKRTALMDQAGKLWEHRGFPGQAKALRENVKKIREIDTRLYQHYHYGGWMEYMPREYLKHIENKQQILQFFNPKKYRIRTPWKKGRKEIPVEVRTAMGEILEPAYPMYNAVARESRAIATYDLFQDIAKNPKWVWTGEGQIPRGWVQISKTDNLPTLGDLAGKYVRPDIAEEINRMGQLFTRGQEIYRKSLGIWKWGKVVPRMGTHMRNIYNNLIFADFAGLSPFDPGTYKWLAKAIKEYRSRGQSYTELLESGLIGTEYYGTEIIQPVTKYLSTQGKTANLFDNTSDLVKAGFAKLGEIYQAEDQVFKLAIYMKGRAGGLDKAKALAQVDKWMPNYLDVPGITRSLRQSPLGAPFFSFKSEAIRIAMNAAKEHPVKLAYWMILPGAMTDISAKTMGMTDDEVDRLMAQLPSYARKGMHALVPSNKDEPRFIDLTYIMFLGDIVESADPVGFMSNPVFTTAYAVATRGSQGEAKELYSDKSITRPGMTLPEEMGAWLQHLWRQAVPSTFAMPGSYDYEKMRKAILGKKDVYTGKEPSLGWEALNLFGGVRTRTFGERKEITRRHMLEKRTKHKKLEKEVWRLSAMMRYMSDKDRTEALRKIRQLQEQMRKLWVE